MTDKKNPKPAGFQCPKCQFFIEVSIQSLLFEAGHQCPRCATLFSMDRGQSTEALQLIQKLHVAMKNLDSVKEFKM
jgi:uncharacterized paraquat-inducible protein A